MPDEKGNTKLDEDDLPETSLHAHGSKIEDQERREEDVEGEILDDDDGQDASQVPNTGGSTSGGPGGDATGEEDPSNV